MFSAVQKEGVQGSRGCDQDHHYDFNYLDQDTPTTCLFRAALVGPFILAMESPRPTKTLRTFECSLLKVEAEAPKRNANA